MTKRISLVIRLQSVLPNQYLDLGDVRFTSFGIAVKTVRQDCTGQGSVGIPQRLAHKSKLFVTWMRVEITHCELSRPSGLAFDADDNLYVVDSGNNRVQKFTKEGQFLGKCGTPGSGDGEFNMPWGIAIDSQGDVYIADWRNDRIQKFSPDGHFLMKFGTSGAGEGEFNRPSGVAVDKDGIIYVADWMNDRLQVFDVDGSFVTMRTGDGTVSKWGQAKLDANAEMWGERERAHGLDTA